jgi:hypothetical protein
MTLSMTLGITTLSITTLSIMTLSMTLSIMKLGTTTLSIRVVGTHYCYAEGRASIHRVSVC